MKITKTVQLIIFILFPILSFSQKSRLKYANEMFDQLAYFDAAEGYEDVLERNIDSNAISNKLARCYDEVGKSEKALEWYRYIHATSKLSKDEFYRLALLEREFGNYDISKKYMNEFVEAYGETDVSRSILSSDLSMDDLLTSDENFKIKNQSINSVASEIGVSYISNDEILVASSTRKEYFTKNVFSGNGGHFYEIYKGSVNLDGDINQLSRLKGNLSSKFHDGPAVYDSKTNFVYFTRNNYTERKKGTNSEGVMLLKIYRTKNEDENFEFAEELAFNSDEYSCAHPSISADGKTLFFASDMPGGYGGMDIYSIELSELNNSTPKNLGGQINTSLNDIFPHYNTQSDLLFFSSEGHAGLGGLDVFAVKLEERDNTRAIQNLGAPINSMKDDFCFVSNEGQTRGFFSSNRSGGSGSDDIYSFTQQGPLIESASEEETPITGVISDGKTNSPLEGVAISIVDKTSGDLSDETKTKEDGSFNTKMNYNVDSLANYRLKIEREGYKTKTIDLTKELVDDSELRIDESMNLKNIETVEVEEIEVGVTDLAKVIEINPIYFGLNNSVIRDDAKEELDKIAEILHEHPSMEIALYSHTDSRGDYNYNLQLSHQRAVATGKYLKSKGIASDRIRTEGMGEKQLIISDSEIEKVSSEEEKETLHQKNRRTEFIVIKM